jgi:hypothetical protein
VVEVVMTPSDWDDYVSTIWGDGDPSVTPIRSRVLSVPRGTPYLVYGTYDWEPSSTAEPPEDD